MAARWDEVSASPDYQGLPAEEKRKVQERYWTNVVATSEDYQGLDPTQQARVRNRFFGPEVKMPSASPRPEPKGQPSASFPSRKAAYDAVVSGKIKAGDMVSTGPRGRRMVAVARRPAREADLASFSPEERKRILASRAPLDLQPVGAADVPPGLHSAPPQPDTMDLLLEAAQETGREATEKVFRPVSRALKSVPVNTQLGTIPSAAQLEQEAAAGGAVNYPGAAGRAAMDSIIDLIVPESTGQALITAAAGPVLRGAGTLAKAAYLDEAVRPLAQAAKSRMPTFFPRAAAPVVDDGAAAVLGAEPPAPVPGAAPAGVPPAAAAADDATAQVLGVQPGQAPAAVPPAVVPEIMPRKPPLVGGAQVERIANRPQFLKRTAARVQGMPAGAVRGPVPNKDFFGQQLGKFAVEDDAKAVFDETSEAFKSVIDRQRRGKIDWAGTEKMAQNLGMTTEDLVRGNRGQAFTAEKLEAAKALTAESLERVTAAQRAYLENPGDASLASLAGEMARHARVQASFMGARAEAGRALQILRKVTDPANLAKRNYQALLDALGGRELTEEAAQILSSIDPSDFGAVNRFLREWTRAKTSDQLYEFYINGLLSGPMTHKLNMVSNALFTASRVPEKLVRGGLDAAVGAVTGRRTAYASEALPEAYAAIKGIPDGLRAFLKAWGGAEEGSKIALEIDRLPAIKGPLGKVARLPSRMLQASDAMAKSINSRMEIAARALRMAKQEGLKGAKLAARVAELEANPTDEMIEAATKSALYRTFQDKSGVVAQAFMGLRKIPGVRYIIPFLKVPERATARALERSPFGFIGAARAIAQGRGQEVAVERAANAALGSGVAAAVAAYTAQGRVTGEAPKDPGERDRFFRSGKLPYSVKIGDKWYQYNRLGPVSAVIGMTANVVGRAMESGEDGVLENLAPAIARSVPKFLLDQAALTGLRDFVEALEDPDRSGKRFLQRSAAGFIPFSAFSRFIAQQLDDVVRQPDNLQESLMANIPGLSKRLPARYDAYGQAARRPNDLFSTLVVPRSQARATPLDDEDLEIGRDPQGFPGRSMGGVPLSPKEHREVVKTSGRLLAQLREAVRRLPGWKTLPAAARVKAVDQLQAEAREEGRRRVYRVVLKRLPSGPVREAFIKYGEETLFSVPRGTDSASDR